MTYETLDARQLVPLTYDTLEERLSVVMGLIEEPAWHARAACKGTGLDFYTRLPTVRKQCLAVCLSCPVRVSCREEGVTSGTKTGIWGGLSSKQLLKERQARRKAEKEGAA